MKPGNITAPEGKRFVITLTFPSGGKAVLGAQGDKIALIFVDGDKKMGDIISWKDSDDLIAWLEKFKEEIGERDWPHWAALKPRVDLITVVH